MAKRKDEALPPETCISVKDYEKSLWWRNKSKQLLTDHDATCEICGRPRFRFQTRKKAYKRILRFCVHHTTYKNVPYEKREDLMILCWQCHDISHLVLRLENLGLFYKELAKIVRRHFKYDKDSAKQNSYLNGKKLHG